MADQKISDLDALTSVADGDEFVVVDKSDTSMSASGTNKRITSENVLKPLRDTFETEHNADGTHKAGITDNLFLTVANLLNPVGTIREFTVSTNPATLLGFGTWTEFGKGRVTVGRDAGQTEFDTVEEIGGAKTHTLTTGEIPNLQGYISIHDVANGTNLYAAGGVFSTSSVVSNKFKNGGTGTTGANSVSQINFNNGGGGQTHNNLQPYIVVYRWKRTA